MYIMGDSATHRQWMSDSWGGWSSIQTLAYKSFILVICRAQTDRAQQQFEQASNRDLAVRARSVQKTTEHTCNAHTCKAPSLSDQHTHLIHGLDLVCAPQNHSQLEGLRGRALDGHRREALGLVRR